MVIYMHRVVQVDVLVANLLAMIKVKVFPLGRFLNGSSH